MIDHTKTFGEQIFGQLTRMNEAEALRFERDKLKLENAQLRTVLCAILHVSPDLSTFVATLNAARDLLQNL